MRARFVILAVAVLGVVAARPAGAETAPPGGGAYIDPDGNPTADARDREDQGGSGGGGGSSGQPVCTWHVAVRDDFAFPVYDADGSRLYSSTGRWLMRICDGLGQVAVDGLFTIPEGELVDPEALAQEALASVAIDVPAIRTSPDGRLVVRVPTWLWLDGGWWRGYEATASAGRVTSTVTATPTRTAWSMGDGGSVSCGGPGVAWHAGLPEGATDCSYTYTTSSAGRPGGTFEVTATVSLKVTWTSNAGPGGELPVISRAASRPVEVGEIQAIGTR